MIDERVAANRSLDPSLRVLARLVAGDAIGPTITRGPSDSQASRLADGLVVASLGWYSAPSPWGAPLAAPSSSISMSPDVPAGFPPGRIEPAVGLWGAMELRHHGRPLHCDEELTVTRSVAALGQTPRTETSWYDLTAGGADGAAVASTRVLTGFATASPVVDDGATP